MPSEQLQNVVAMLGAMDSEAGPSTVEEWRAAYQGLGSMLPHRDGVPVARVDADGVPAEWVGEGSGPVVIYLHGGGYCIGSLDTHRAMLTHLAEEIEGRVLAVDYRLAPEHPYPAALDDAVTAYRFARRTVAAEDIVIAGDSAGGGLTVATLVALRDAGDVLPAAGVCLSPWADLTQSGDSVVTKSAVDPMVRAEDLDRWAMAYAGGEPSDSPGISPLFASLHDLPPLLVEVGTAEILLDDARRLATRAREAGVDVELHVAEGLIHVWHFFAGMVPEADDGIRRVAGFVRARTRASA